MEGKDADHDMKTTSNQTQHANLYYVVIQKNI